MRCTYVDFFLLVVSMLLTPHFGRGHSHWYCHRNVNKVVPYADSRPPRQFKRSVVCLLQGFDDIPRLTLHHRNLSCKHAFLKVRVKSENPSQGQLGFTPPRG